MVACAFLVAIGLGEGLSQAALWATVLALPAGMIAAGAGVVALMARPSTAPVTPEFEVPEWVIDRPAELEQVVSALTGWEGRYGRNHHGPAGGGRVR